jgi:hypothetical protein
MNLVSLLIAWLVTSISLFIISKLPTGVEIDESNLVSSRLRNFECSVTSDTRFVSLSSYVSDIRLICHCSKWDYLWVSGLFSNRISLALGILERFDRSRRPRHY